MTEQVSRLGQINGALGDIESEFAAVAKEYISPYGDLKDIFIENGELLLESLGDLFKSFAESGIAGVGSMLVDLLAGFIADLFAGFIEDLLSLDTLIPEFMEDMFDKLDELIPFDLLNIGAAFPALGSFGDCFRNIDDILVESLKKKMNNFALGTPVGMGAANLMNITFKFVGVVEGKIQQIVELTESSIMDLVIAAQNAVDALARTKIMAKLISAIDKLGIDKALCLIGKLTGKVLDNIGGALTSLIGGIMSFDPCKLFERGENGEPANPRAEGIPVPSKVPEKAPEVYPITIAAAAKDPDSIQVQDLYRQAMWNAGDVLSKDHMADMFEASGGKKGGTNAQHISANTQAHLLARGFLNAIQAGNVEAGEEQFDKNVKRILEEKALSGEWAPTKNDPNPQPDASLYFETVCMQIKNQMFNTRVILEGHAGIQDQTGTDSGKTPKDVAANVGSFATEKAAAEGEQAMC